MLYDLPYTQLWYDLENFLMFVMNLHVSSRKWLSDSFFVSNYNSQHIFRLISLISVLVR